ncbi:FAD-dependent oxidoreductase [Sphingomonas sp. ID1715]|uniref:FAD-dependent oxidoreductase n=1 Tax=Sphingomonas sp. ID1715 TaxID=1656898 RepID=UPI00148960A8|nr:FAD-dependent oxidoreductase [Sphingomonas sp. ID1715]NNM75384.1 FAD-dependent oxidoreductase [Sphingomonas sp. ID1715]
MAEHQLVIAGGGPAGMMAGLLFARAGVRTLVLEKHGDFLRDFRGDTVHPSTLDLMDQLGLLDRFLERPHDKVRTLGGRAAGRQLTIADFSHLPVRAPYIAMMPQWEFLDFLADEARRYPSFTLRMNAEAVGLHMEEGQVTGVELACGEICAACLVIAADGRRSVLRGAASLPLRDLGAPIDVLWFRLPRKAGDPETTGGTFGPGTLVVQINRGDYWQCAYVVPKGGAEALRAAGLDAFRRTVAAASPTLTEAVQALTDWDQLRLLSVSLDRLERWWMPGLLAIGDAAHAMSPVGGVGINLAIQDAVAAANILAEPLAQGAPVYSLLAKVQQRRLLPTRIIQRAQKTIHDRLLKPLISGQISFEKPPLAMRLLNRAPLLQRIPARLVGLGVRREHIRSPDAFGS